MLIVNQLGGFGAFIQPTSVSYSTAVEDGSNLTTYSFAGVAFPAAAARRSIAVAANGTGAAGGITISDITIAGTVISAGASLIQAAGANRGICGLACAATPTGATGTISVTFSGGIIRCGIGVWALYDLTSTTPALSATSTSATSVQSLDINIQAGDILLATAYVNGDAGATTCTWTGVTKRFDGDLEGARHSGGDFSAVAAESPRTVTATFSAVGDRGAGVAATFR